MLDQRLAFSAFWKFMMEDVEFGEQM